MNRFLTFPSAAAVLAISVALAGCHQPSNRDESAVVAAGNASLPALPATLPLSADPATTLATAPAAVQLPGARRLPVARVSDPRARYAYADDAGDFADAIGDSPPDYTFDYDGGSPWAWQGYDGSATYVERVPDGFRTYYYRPGADAPYFVRDPDYGYGYDDGRLAAVYDRGGQALPYDAYDSRIEDASRYYARSPPPPRAIPRQWQDAHWAQDTSRYQVIAARQEQQASVRRQDADRTEQQNQQDQRADRARQAAIAQSQARNAARQDAQQARAQQQAQVTAEREQRATRQHAAIAASQQEAAARAGQVQRANDARQTQQAARAANVARINAAAAARAAQARQASAAQRNQAHAPGGRRQGPRRCPSIMLEAKRLRSPSRREALAGAATLLMATPLIGEATAQVMPSNGSLQFAAGRHRIDRSQVVHGSLWLAPGAELEIAEGAVLRIEGDLSAPGERIFFGTGMVDLSGSRVVAARAEWWGAAPNQPAIDSGPAIAAALAAHTAVQLGPGDYFLADTLVIELHNRRLWGVGRTKDARSTRLVLQGTGTVLRLGPATPPREINDHVRGLDIRWIEIGRSVPPQPGTAAIGVAVGSVLDCLIDGVRSNEHAIGFAIRGAVRTTLRDCAAFRSTFGGSADDGFVGYDMNGVGSAIPTGANASLYLIDCVAQAGNRPHGRSAIGCRMTGGFSDTFLVRFETTSLTHGILVDGRADPLRASTPAYSHLDLHIETAILDQCERDGISLANLPPTSMIDVSGCWVAVAANGGAGIRLRACGGPVSILGGQIVLGSDAEAGIAADVTRGLTCSGTKLLDALRPIVLRASEGFDVSAAIVVAGIAPAGAAVTLADCSRGIVRAKLLGHAGACAVGVQADASTHGVTVETFALAPVCTTPVATAGSNRLETAGSTVVIGRSAA